MGTIKIVKSFGGSVSGIVRVAPSFSLTLTELSFSALYNPLEGDFKPFLEGLFLGAFESK